MTCNEARGNITAILGKKKPKDADDLLPQQLESENVLLKKKRKKKTRKVRRERKWSKNCLSQTPLQEEKRKPRVPGKTKVKVSEELTAELLPVHALEDTPWLERLNDWEEGLWKLEDRWRLKNMGEGWEEKMREEFPDFAR